MTTYSRKIGTTVLAVNAVLMAPKMVLMAAKTMYDEGVMDIPTEDMLWSGFQNLMAYMVEDEDFDPQDLYQYPIKVEFGLLEDVEETGDAETVIDRYYYIGFDNGYLMRLNPGEDINSDLVTEMMGLSEIPVESDVKKALEISSKVMTRLPKKLKEATDRDAFQLRKPLSVSDANSDGIIEGELVNVDTNEVVGKVNYDTRTDKFKWKSVK